MRMICTHQILSYSLNCNSFTSRIFLVQSLQTLGHLVSHNRVGRPQIFACRRQSCAEKTVVKDFLPILTTSLCNYMLGSALLRGKSIFVQVVGKSGTFTTHFSLQKII